MVRALPQSIKEKAFLFNARVPDLLLVKKSAKAALEANLTGRQR